MSPCLRPERNTFSLLQDIPEAPERAMTDQIDEVSVVGMYCSSILL